MHVHPHVPHLYGYGNPGGATGVQIVVPSVASVAVYCDVAYMYRLPKWEG